MPRVSLAAGELSECLESLQTSFSSLENRNDLEAMFALYQSWEKVVTEFAPILAKCPISVFLSHAWHIVPKDSDPQIERDYRYYDMMDLSIAKILKLAGFQVLYDKDVTASKGIIAQGTDGFMESEVGQADLVLSFCTPLYHDRARMPGTGVFKEVERIKQRISDFSSSSFFIPMLLHALIPHYPSDQLMVGNREERIYKSIYLDLRCSHEFVSNVWKILHRMFNNFRRKVDESIEEMSERNTLLQQYVEVLGKLLEYDDYFDLVTHKTIRSNAKDDLQRLYNSLRTFTTVPSDIDPNELIRQLKEEMNKHSELFDASQGKDIVAFLGSTGVGKSTLINYLAGKQLKTDRLKQSYQLVDEEDRSAMKIGMGTDSETIYPQWIAIGKDVYFDLPGFSDSKGSVQDLVNAAFIRQVLVNARTVRLVFVVGSDEVTSQRGKVVKQFFTAIRSVFPMSSVVDDSSVLIVSKSTFPFARQADVVEYLRMKLRSGVTQNDLSNTLKLWETGNRILHIPNPMVDDISNQVGVRESIIQVISTLKAASQEQVRHFDMSKFYPQEIHFPLKNMFLQLLTSASPIMQIFTEMETKLAVIAEQTPKDELTLATPVTAFFEFDRFGKSYQSFQETLASIKTEINQYLDSDYFQHHHDEVESRLSQEKEIKLLIEICQEPYNDAKKDFETTWKTKITTLKDRTESLESSVTAGIKKYQELQSVLEEVGSFLQFGINFSGNNNGNSSHKDGSVDKKLVELVDSVSGHLDLSSFGIDSTLLRIRMVSLTVKNSGYGNFYRIRERDDDGVPIFPGLEVIIIPSILVNHYPEMKRCLDREFPKLLKLVPHHDCIILFSARNRYLRQEEAYRFCVVGKTLRPSLYGMWSTAQIVKRDWKPMKALDVSLSSDYVDLRHETIARTSLCCGVCLCCAPGYLSIQFLYAFAIPLIPCMVCFDYCIEGNNKSCCQLCADKWSGCYSEVGELYVGMQDCILDGTQDEEVGFVLCCCQILCVSPCTRCCLLHCYYGDINHKDASTAEALEKLQLTISVKSKPPVKKENKKTIAVIPTNND